MKPRRNLFLGSALVAASFPMLQTKADIFDTNSTTSGFGVTNGGTYDWWTANYWSDGTGATNDAGTAATVTWQGTSGNNQQAYFIGSGTAGQNYTVRLGSTGTTDTYIQNIAINVKADGTGTLTGAAGNVTIGSSGDTGKLILSAANSVGAQNSGTLTINNVVDLNAKALNFRGGNVVINGSIIGTGASNIASGSGFGLTSGTLTLAGDNSFAGTTSVASGYIFSLKHANALGATGGTNTVSSGGTMEVAGGVSINSGESVSIAGDGVSSFGALRAGTGGGTWAGGVTLTGAGAGPRIGATAGNTLTVTGTIANGTGNSFNISGQSGTGVVILNPTTSNSYTGTTGIIRGILRIGKNNALPTGTTLDVDSIGSVSDAATFDLASFSQEVAVLQDSATSNVNGKITNSVTSTISTLTVNQASDTDFGGIIENGTGSVVLTKSGVGNLTLSGANTFTGGTNIKNGSIIISGGDDRLATGGSVVLGDVATSGKLVVGTAAVARSQTLAGLTTTGLGGSVVGAYSTNSTLTLNIASGTNTYDGKLGGAGTNENNLALTKLGSGTLVLSGANTYSGNTLFGSALGTSTGVLRLANSSALGTGKLIINNGNTDTGTVELTGGITIANNIDFFGRSSFSTAAIIRNVSGNNELSGILTGGLNGTSYNIHSDSGILTISNTLTSTASATGRAISLRGAGTINITGAISDGSVGGANSVRTLDAGTYILAGNNSYTGLTSLAGTNGTLKLGSVNAINGGGGLTISNAGTLDNSSGGALVMNNVGTVTLSNNLNFGGTNALTINSAVNQTADLTVGMYGTGALTLGNYTNTKAGNITLNVYDENSGNASALTLGSMALSNDSNSRTLTLGNNGSADGKLIVSGIISNGGTATASAVTMNYMKVTLQGDNSFAGGFTLGSAGTLNMDHAGALGSGTFTINGGTLNNTSGSAIVNSKNNVQAWNGDFTFTGTNDLDLGTGAVTIGGTRQVTVNGGNLTVGGVISGSGFQLRKAGNNGSLTLTGANAYTGNTLISAGRLYLNHTADSNPAILGNVSLSTSSNTARPYLYLLADNQLESTATISASISGGNTTYTDFVLGGRSQTIAGYSASGAVGSGTNYIENRPFADLGGGNGVLTINNSSTVTLGGGTGSNRVNIRDGGSGTLALVKDGAGTLVFNLNSADYSGGFTLKNGLVQVAGTAFGASTSLKFEGGTLSSGSTTARTFGTGNTVSFDGNVTLGDSTNNGKLTFAGAGTLTGNRELTTASDVDYTGAIGQDVAGRSLTKLGAGTLTLTNTNTYTGATQVNGGTLEIATGGSLDAGSAVSVSNSGSELIVNGTVGGTLLVNTSTTLSGAGTINGAATINGTHNPGNSPGLQTFTSGLSYGSTAVLNAEFVGNTLGLRGTDFDGIDVTGGDLSIASLATLNLLTSGIDYTLAAWDISRNFTVIDFSGGGTSSGLFTLNTSGAGSFMSEGSWSLANTSNDIVLSWTPVPEPRAAILGLLGTLALLRRRR